MAEGGLESKEIAGLELFRFEVTKVLESTEEQPVIISGQFPREYRRIFGEKFNPEKYGFQTKSLYGYFNHISDVVRFARKNEKLAIALKEKDEGLTTVQPLEKAEETTVLSDDEDLSNICEDESLQGFAKQTFPRDQAEGIELLRSHTMMILSDSEGQKIELSHFRALYKNKFKTPFRSENYKLKGKLLKVLKNTMLDLIDFELAGSVVYIKLNCSNKVQQVPCLYNTESKIDYQTDACKNPDVISSLACVTGTLGKPALPSPSYSDSYFTIPGSESKVSSDSKLPSSTSIGAMRPHNLTGTNMQCIAGPSQSERSESNPTQTLKLSGIELLKSEVRHVLHGEGKISVNNFQVLYQQKFNACFTGCKYKIKKIKRLSTLLKRIPDVVTLDVMGIELYMELNDQYGDNVNEVNDENQISSENMQLLQSKVSPSTHTQASNCYDFSEPPMHHSDWSREENVSDGISRTNLTPLLSEGLLSNPIQPSKSNNYTDKSDEEAQEIGNRSSSASANKSLSGKASGALTGKALFAHEVREVLQRQGRMDLSKFVTAYKSRFKATFNAHKYQFAGSKKLSSLMNEIPDIVSLTQKKSKVFVELVKTSKRKNERESDVTQVSSASTLLPPSLETVSMAATKTTPCLPITSTELKPLLPSTLPPQVMTPQLQEDEEPLLVDRLLMSRKKTKNAKPRKTDEEDTMMPFPSSFEDSFNSAQDIQSSISLGQPRHTKYTPYKVNELAKQVIKEIAEEGNYVSIELVKAKMCKVIGVRNLKEIGFRNPDSEIPELKDLQRLHSKLDLFGRAYVMVHSIATLTELGQSMARLVEKRDFSELSVGPLVKLPVVYDLFKAPSDDTVVQNITTMQVLKNLNKYLTSEEKWTTKVKMEEFIQFLCDEYECDSAYELGVRVQSVGLGISVLKRAQKAQSERSKEVEQELIVDLEKDFQRRCKKIKDDLLGASHGDERSLLGKLLGTPVTEILTAVYKHCSPVFQYFHTIKERDLKKVERCLEVLVETKVLREMFNMALHMGCKSIIADILEVCKGEIKETYEREEQEKMQAIKPPKKRELKEEIKQWFSSAEDLKLSTLARIEDSVTNPFRPDFPSFLSFGYGPFLEFVTKQPELNKLLEERGALLGRGAVNLSQSRDMGVLDFVEQCGLKTSKDVVERAVCDHYGVKKVEDLGHGGHDNIISTINLKNQQHQSNVFYESAILSKDGSKVPSPSAIPGSPYKAGLLGWKYPDDALKALISAPLLSDLTEWTQWTLVFQPCLGDLKQFIDDQSKGKVQVLETSGKSLLKIDIDTSLESFNKCVDQYDVIGTSGTLVSLVVKSGGIHNTPLALLTNHMRPALSKLASADQENVSLSCPQFVLECLCRMPQSMCIALAYKVFLEPFGHAVGTTNTYHKLLSCCTDDHQRSRLHQLGLFLGKSDWVKDFESLITGDMNRVENRKPISLRELKPTAVVKPVESVEQKEVIDNEESLEGSTDDTESLSDSDSDSDSDKEIVDSEEEPPQAKDDEETVTQLNPFKELIDTIRKEEFGIGVVLGEEEGKLVQKQREREGRSLHRLSAELYNRDTHFVLELVQNADDNTYQTDEIPALMFVVDGERIMVLNNEVGFSEKNIRALCDVGKSTKGPHQYGYIGQKGIGFKSVFRISDKPEVHSNGYHIRFDAKSGPSGYILPHWVEEDTEENQKDDGAHEVDDDLDEWMTKIVLPLKDEFHSDKKTALSARFHDVHPSLLLFLHRLRSIVIVKDKDVQKMTREDLSDGIIEIQHGHETDRWLVVKKQLSASHVREDVDKTELALAFPMPPEHTKNMASYKALPQQNVFAYLPLRSYGFKFIIQGDFEVPSSREDVDEDKAWNQWLREEIPKLFINALDVFKQHPSFPGLHSVAKFFQFVPLEEEILGFFAPVASAILKYLQGIPCLPVEKTDSETQSQGNTSNQDTKDYDWMQPCTVVVCDDPKVRTFIAPHLLHKHLNLNYIAPEVATAINPAMRAKLGVKTLSTKHVMDIGRAVLNDSGNHDVKWIAQWLHCIYRCMEHEHNSSTEILHEIASMKVIPLSESEGHSTLVNLKDNAVFFPLSVEQATKTKKKKPKASYLAALERDLSVLHPELLSHLGNVGHSQVQKLLSRLGVKSWSPNDVIQNHIIPTLKSDKWKEKPHDVLRSYIVYIFDQYMTDSSIWSMEELKGCCQVLTNKGPTTPSVTPVHFTPRYGYELDLKNQLPSINWTLLDDSYLELSIHHNVTNQDWQKFFTSLGVGRFLAIERKTTKLNKMNLGTSPWVSYQTIWPSTSDGCYTVEDYYCSELEEFMKSNKDPKQAKIIAENIDKLWANQYSKYADKIPVTDTEGRKLSETWSSFMIHLRERAWLPVSGSSPCQVPRDLFRNTDQLRMLLDSHVHYACVSLGDESFVSSIGLVSSITVEDILKHLRTWSSSVQSPGTDGFKTSLKHMKNVYAFLHDQCHNPTKVTDAFKKNPLIFVPGERSQDPEKLVRGKFYSMKEVCWNDPSDVTQKLQLSKKYTPKRQILSPHYRDIHDFLRLVLHVDLTPHADEYIEMAAVLVGENSVPTPAVIESILEIFAVLGEKCQTDKNNAQYLQKRLREEAIFPCGERWVALSEQPIIPDSKTLKKIFEKEKGVHFITLESSQRKSRAAKKSKAVEEKREKSVKDFLQACGILKLSEIVEEELTPKNVEYQCHEIQLYFHKVIPSIQRYLYSHMEDRYSELKDQSIGKKLTGMTFATVRQLEVVYRLKLQPEVTIAQEIKYSFENVGQTLHFYAVQQQSKSIESLNKAITKLFIDAGDSVIFSLFLSSLSNKLGNGLEDFLEEHDAFQLPENEEVWFIPEPEIPKTPEPEVNEEFLPPPVRRQKRSDDDGEMHCWPPRSSVAGVKPSVRESNPNKQKADELWPQPDAPESMRNDPQSLEGSRLQSYIKTSTGYNNTDKTAETDKRKGLKDDSSSSNLQHPQSSLPFEKPTSSPAIQDQTRANEGIVDANLIADTREDNNETPVTTPDISSPVPMPYPSDGTILPSLPDMHQPQCSTPNTTFSSPSVFSPCDQVMLQDLEYEELPSEHIVTLPLNVSLNDSSDKPEIGRWGEELVNEYLKREAVQHGIEREIIWMSREDNSTAPFDIQVTSPDGDVTYIEVKSTSTDHKEYFEISIKELQFALKQRASLHLYRVFNVGSSEAKTRIVRVKNLAEHLERKSVKIFMVI